MKQFIILILLLFGMTSCVGVDIDLLETEEIVVDYREQTVTVNSPVNYGYVSTNMAQTDSEWIQWEDNNLSTQIKNRFENGVQYITADWFRIVFVQWTSFATIYIDENPTSEPRQLMAGLIEGVHDKYFILIQNGRPQTTD